VLKSPEWVIADRRDPVIAGIAVIGTLGFGKTLTS
jgi:hypothetical protein